MLVNILCIFILQFYLSSATTCTQLKTLYSDLTCCSNRDVDTCLRTIPLCDSATDGEICTDATQQTIIKGGIASIAIDNNSIKRYANGTIYVADANAHVAVDNITIKQHANGTIYVADTVGVSSFDGNYSSLTNKPSLFDGDYNSLTNKLSVDNSTIKQYANGTIYVPSETATATFSSNAQGSISYNDLTDKPTLFSGNYSDLTNKPDLSGSVAVDNSTIKQYANGTIYVASAPVAPESIAVVTREGQVLEELIGVRDGRSVTVESGTYTLTDVNAFQMTNPNAWETLTGSDIDYVPPVGTTQVVYIMSVSINEADDRYMAGFRFVIDGSIVTNMQPVFGETHTHTFGVLMTIKFVIDIGTDDIANGKLATWNSVKSLKLEVKSYSNTNYQVEFHGTRRNMYSTSVVENIVKPILNIRAIGVQLNYIEFEATSTALMSAQTFEVTDAECSSSALQTSIYAQWVNFGKVVGSGSYNLNEAALPKGCILFESSDTPSVNRIGFNANQADADDKFGSGYRTWSQSYRICKYANGDFVLLTDPTQRCNQVHFTLPDNLETLAGVLQTDNTNIGIGINPTVPLHVGTDVSTNISVSRFECDGTGSITEQTSGEVTTVMSQADCNAQSTIPTVSAIKTADAKCVSENNSPYNYNAVEVTSGTPLDNMSEKECQLYQESNYPGSAFNVMSNTARTHGCVKITYGGAVNGISYNTAANSYDCGTSFGGYVYTCVQKDSSSTHNPGTTDQARIDACRDACMDRSKALFSGTWGFRSASFWVEPTGGQCFCGAESPNVCIQEISTFYELYELNNPPKGCFKDRDGNYYYNDPSDDNYGVCSNTYTCLVKEGNCLVQDNTLESKTVSMIVEKSAWFKQELVVSSDRRIKANITDVLDARATMRQIPTRTYNYLDKMKWGGNTIGFIAQEVKDVIPEAVKIESGFLPNLLKKISCTFERNGTLKMTCPELTNGRIRLFVTDDIGESLLDIDVKEGVSEVEKVYKSVFAYGYEVQDFHTLEKSKLFALNFAATKEIDIQVQWLLNEIQGLKDRVHELEQL